MDVDIIIPLFLDRDICLALRRKVLGDIL